MPDQGQVNLPPAAREEQLVPPDAVYISNEASGEMRRILRKPRAFACVGFEHDNKELTVSFIADSRATMNDLINALHNFCTRWRNQNGVETEVFTITNEQQAKELLEAAKKAGIPVTRKKG